jgi:hypothetical protein
MDGMLTTEYDGCGRCLVAAGTATEPPGIYLGRARRFRCLHVAITRAEA